MGTLLLLPLALSCITVGDPERTAYQPEARISTYNAPPGTADNFDWRTILRAKPRIQFQVLHTGQVRVPRSGMLNLEHPAMQGTEDGEMYVDVFAFHICHTREGCYLIDSGLDDSFRTGRGGNISGLMASSYVIDTRQDEGQDIAAQLNAHTQNNLRGVFFTHLHGDHTSGVPALPKDIRFIAGKNDEYINYYLLYHSDHLAGVQHLEEIDFTNAPEHAPLGRVVDLFGDGSFWAISTPGHSRGHVSYLVISQDGPILLTGDASHTRLGFEKGVEPGWTYHRADMQQSLKQLRAFAQEYPEVRVIFGHER